MPPQNNAPWWRDSIIFFVRASAWIAGPVLVFVFIGLYAKKRWGIPMWMFAGLLILGFIFSCIGITREGLAYIKKIEEDSKKDKERNEKDRGNT